MKTQRLVLNEQATAMSLRMFEIQGEMYAENNMAVNTAEGVGLHPLQEGIEVETGFVNPAGTDFDGESFIQDYSELPSESDGSRPTGQIPGYENVGHKEVFVPPPANDEDVRDPPPYRTAVDSVTAISDQEAKDAIIQYVSEHCCYGKGPAQGMQINEMKSFNAFHYTLETFGESRSTVLANKPYMGESIVVSGPPPGPWDIQLEVPEMFTTSTVELEVPNTESVHSCFYCNGKGETMCLFCYGLGKRRMCMHCCGSGFQTYYEGGLHHMRTCMECTGGYTWCMYCNGQDKLTCIKCLGIRKLRWFILLTVRWTNHVDDHIVERRALPDEMIRTVTGHTVFEEIHPRVWPVDHFPDQEINTASNNLVSRHAEQFPTERILMQRHRIHIIPVTEVFYNYKKQQNSTFFVYGKEHKVYAPDYPATCCWGCTVL